MRLITRSLKTVFCLGLLAASSVQGADYLNDASLNFDSNSQSRLSLADQEQVASLLRPSDEATVQEDSRPRMQFNLSAAKAIQSSEAGDQIQQVGCTSGGCDQSSACDCDASSAEVCTPRRPVSLPTSTFHEYFNSDRCNTGVWDGYSRKCSPLKPTKCCLDSCGSGCGEILPARPRQIRVWGSGASSCDSPACDAPGCDG
jgi:hypothetical protein